MDLETPGRLKDQSLKGSSTACVHGALATFESEPAGKDRVLCFASASIVDHLLLYIQVRNAHLTTVAMR